ncbi:MAG: prohibitin family protein [Kiritimatiellae bacterium]|nr:prohibitin family protein [Kiritimatiellia bacterium]
MSSSCIDPRTTKSAAFSIFVVAAIVIAFVMAGSFVSIDAGHVGVVTQFGRVTGRILEPGLHWITPWEECQRFDCRVQKFEGDTECFSKDLQLVGVKLSLLTTLQPSKAREIYETIGGTYMPQVIPRVWEILKQQIAAYNAEEVIEKREAIRLSILKACKERLAEVVEVNDVVLVNITFSDVYEKAIEQKQVAQQEALRARYELDRAKTEAQKAIEVAKGEAEAIRVRGEALKDNPGIAQLEAIKKWNGVSPQTVVLGSGVDVPVVFPVQ